MKKFSVLALLLLALSFLMVPGSVHAAGEIESLFAVVDLDAVMTGVFSVLTFLVGIVLLFVGFRFINHALGVPKYEKDSGGNVWRVTGGRD